MKLLPILCLILCGCVTTTDGQSRLSPEGQIALETSVRIAVRHAIADSPRAQEKVQHIRAIVARVQAVTSAESTLAALKEEVKNEIGKLELSPLDKQDAMDLIELFAVALEARLGPDKIQAEGLVKINEFLGLILTALPPIS